MIDDFHAWAARKDEGFVSKYLGPLALGSAAALGASAQGQTSPAAGKFLTNEPAAVAPALATLKFLPVKGQEASPSKPQVAQLPDGYAIKFLQSNLGATSNNMLLDRYRAGMRPALPSSPPQMDGRFKVFFYKYSGTPTPPVTGLPKTTTSPDAGRFLPDR